MKTETVLLPNGEEIAVSETETSFVIEAQDWGPKRAFGARLEIGEAVNHDPLRAAQRRGQGRHVPLLAAQHDVSHHLRIVLLV